jgi:phosphotransferase system IIB component
MEKPLIDAGVQLPNETPSQVGRRMFITDLSAIADRFRVTLKLPDKVNGDDFETIYLLKQYMENGTIELDNISIVVGKSEENRDLLPQQFATGKGFFRFVNMQHEPLPKLFGTAINTGPVVMETEAAINDLSATLQTFQEAEIGTGVRMSLKPLTSVRVSLSSAQEGPE